MEYRKAEKKDLEQIYQLVQDTIQVIYPRCYPTETVAFLVSCIRGKILLLILKAVL
jgi:uncharacterized protein YfkK (UPF0435 family)